MQLQTGEKNRLLFNWTIFRQSPWKIYLWKNVGTAEAHFYRSTAFLTPNWQCQSIKQKQHTSSNASPLPSGWTVFRLSSAEAIFRIGPMHISNVTKGQDNLLEVLVKRKRVAGPTWYKSLGCKICTTKREYLRSIVAGHLHKKWNEVSSSSKHTGHKGSVQAVTTVTCLIKKLCAKWKQFKTNYYLLQFIPVCWQPSPPWIVWEAPLSSWACTCSHVQCTQPILTTKQ